MSSSTITERDNSNAVAASASPDRKTELERVIGELPALSTDSAVCLQNLANFTAAPSEIE